MSVQEPRPRTFVEDARRRQIVDAAIALTASDGLRHRTFARIAERARISPSLISYHFRSKVELDRAIVLDLQEHLESFMAGAADTATSHLDAVRKIVVAFVEYVGRYPVRMDVLRQMDLAATPAVRAGIDALDNDAGVRRWQALLAAGQGVGELRALDTRAAAVAIMGMLSAVPRALAGSPGSDGGRLGTELADFVCAAIARAPDS